MVIRGHHRSGYWASLRVRGVVWAGVPSRFAAWDERHRRRTADVVVGLAGACDLPALGELADAHTGAVGGWFERFADDLREPRSALFVARVDGVLAGYGRVHHFTPPERAPANIAPEGWYLGGLLVHPDWRGRGAGAGLTQARLAWVAERADEAWFYANARNKVSLELHAAVGFEEVTRDFSVPGLAFDGGVGVLCRCRLRGRAIS